MKSLLIGFLLAMLDFEIDLWGSAKIDLLPNFIGYIFILNGCREMSAYSFHFTKAMSFVKGLAVYSLIVFVANLIGIQAKGLSAFIVGLVGFIATLVAVYVPYCVSLGVIDIEHHYGYFMEGEKLKSAWMTSTICSIVAAILTITIILMPVALVVMIVGLVAHIRYLVQLNRAKNLFYEQTGFPG